MCKICTYIVLTGHVSESESVTHCHWQGDKGERCRRMPGRPDDPLGQTYRSYFNFSDFVSEFPLTYHCELMVRIQFRGEDIALDLRYLSSKFTQCNTHWHHWHYSHIQSGKRSNPITQPSDCPRLRNPSLMCPIHDTNHICHKPLVKFVYIPGFHQFQRFL